MHWAKGVSTGPQRVGPQTGPAGVVWVSGALLW